MNKLLHCMKLAQLPVATTGRSAHAHQVLQEFLLAAALRAAHVLAQQARPY